MSLYSILLLLSIAAPLALSFDKKVHFYTHWKTLFPALFLVGLSYIAVDVYFTKIGVWGFNSEYHSKLTVFKLPIDEWLFFLVVPYASLFTHFVLAAYFPKWKLNDKLGKTLSYILLIGFVLLFALNTSKMYTAYAALLMILTLKLSLFDAAKTINRFYISFLVILIPFIAINGILTGSFIDGEVVWYNNDENLGIRLFTIPIEDFAYGFSLLQLSLLAMARFSRLKRSI